MVNMDHDTNRQPDKEERKDSVDSTQMNSAGSMESSGSKKEPITEKYQDENNAVNESNKENHEMDSATEPIQAGDGNYSMPGSSQADENNSSMSESHQANNQDTLHHAAPEQPIRYSSQPEEMQYDDIQFNNKPNEPAKETEPIKQKRTKTKRSGMSAFVGGITGGIVSAAAVLMLVANNMLPFVTDTGNDTNPVTQDASPSVVQTMASEDAETAIGIDEATKAVVGVLNMQKQDIWSGSEETGSGSGIIYKKENGKAYVVTNHHVVANAGEVEIVLDNDERIPAKVLGSDELTDLAVLEVDGKKIDTVAKLGNSEKLQSGETAIAIGNPLGMDFANTLTKGIISGLNRSIEVDTNGDGQADWVTEVIQTDAAINPGNSGGALVNAKGEVIGINSMKIAKEEVEGIGFAIPIDTAQPIINQLETKGEVARPFIGISTASLEQVPPQFRGKIQLPDNVTGGMVIADVENGSPADQAGLKQFDVITKINGEDIQTLLDLRKYMYSETSIGDTIKVEVYRDGQKQTVELTLKERQSI